MIRIWADTVAYWQSGGGLLLLLAAISVGIWSVFFRSRRLYLQALRRSKRQAERLDAVLRATVEDVSGPARTAGVRRDPDAPPARTAAAAGDPDRQADLGVARERPRTDRLDRDVVILGALTVVAPLVGLLGTVMGMMDTFRAVGMGGLDGGGEIAGGISRALITTQFGLVVAIPGVFGAARLQRLRRQLESQREGLRLQVRMLTDRQAAAGRDAAALERA